jgi:hypothetical protein
MPLINEKSKDDICEFAKLRDRNAAIIKERVSLKYDNIPYNHKHVDACMIT